MNALKRDKFFFNLKNFNCLTRCNKFHATNHLSGTTDFYLVLNVDKKATKQQIKLSYYKLSKQFHPDVNQEPGSEDKFKALQEAYHILGDSQRKIEYDRSMNDGYYDGSRRSSGGNGGSGNPFEGGPGFQGRGKKPAGGGYHTGKTSAYDFDTYYQEHYGKRVNRPYTSYQKAQTQEDLNSYWTQFDLKQGEELNEIYQSRNRKLIAFFVAILFMYIFIYQSQRMETKHGLRMEKEKAQKLNANK